MPDDFFKDVARIVVVRVWDFEVYWATCLLGDALWRSSADHYFLCFVCMWGEVG